MKTKKFLAASAVLGTVLAGLAFAAPASAEPITEGYAVVGSDTLQDSMNALVNGTNASGPRVRVTAGGQAVGNWDAFPSTGTGSQIRTKSSGGYFLRPAGSGAGVNALLASIRGTSFNGVTITGQVDIARSSGGPGTNANNAGQVAYIPYARDAVAYAYNGSSADLGSLTTDQLKQIYSSSGKITIGSTTVTARIPQSGSGTRNFFLGALGLTAPGSGVVDNGTAENDASVLQPGEIIPFSVASWVAQSNRVAPSTFPAGSTVALGSPNGVAPFTGSGTALVPNGSFYNAAPFGRDTYLVVEFARIDSTNAAYDPTLAALVDPSVTTSLTGWPAAGASTLPNQPAAVKTKFGFLKPLGTTLQRAYAPQ